MLIDFRERGREGEREGEMHRSVASPTYPTRDRTHNLVMCLDQEANRQPFGLWVHTPANRTTLGRAEGKQF